MKHVMALAAVVLLGACSRPVPDTRSEILGWDVPNSVRPEDTAAQERMQAMAEIYKFTCGPNESFQLADRAKFDQEFQKMLITKGYRKDEVVNEGGAQVLGLTGPKPILAMLTQSSFTLCEVREG